MQNMIEKYRLKTKGNLGNMVFKWGPMVLLVGLVVLLVLIQVTFGNIFKSMEQLDLLAANVMKIKVMVSILLVVSVIVGLLMLWDYVAMAEKRGYINRVYSLIGVVFFFMTLVNVNKIIKISAVIDAVKPSHSVYRIIAWGVIGVIGLILGAVHAFKQDTRIVLESEVEYRAR